MFGTRLRAHFLKKKHHYLCVSFFFIIFAAESRKSRQKG